MLIYGPFQMRGGFPRRFGKFKHTLDDKNVIIISNTPTGTVHDEPYWRYFDQHQVHCRFLSFSHLDPVVLRWRNYTTCNPSVESELLCCHPVSKRQLRRKVAALAIACQDGGLPPLACADFAALFSSSFISPIRPSLIAVLFFTSRVNEVQPNTRAWDWENTGSILQTLLRGSFDFQPHRLGKEGQYFAKLGGKHHLFLLRRGNMTRCRLSLLSYSFSLSL